MSVVEIIWFLFFPQYELNIFIIYRRLYDAFSALVLRYIALEIMQCCTLICINAHLFR